MKKNILMSGLLALAVTVAQASIYEFNYTGATEVNLAIPDGNPGGISSTINVTGTGAFAVRDVNVYLNISSAYNGDLYGYLLSPNGSYAVLLNLIGRDATETFGSSGTGIVVYLDDAGTLGNIHIAGGTLNSGANAYVPDGRITNPLSVVTGDGTGQNLASLNGGTTANGTWTLFLADMSGGDVSSLVSWGLRIDVVPEPATWALMIFGGLMGGVALARRMRRATAA